MPPKQPCPVCGRTMPPGNLPRHQRMHTTPEAERILATPEEQAGMIRLYRSGLTLVQVAAIVHYNATTVRRVLHANGVRVRPPRRGRERQLTTEQVLETTQLYGKGYSSAQVAAILGLSQSAVLERLHRYSSEVRGPGGNVKAKRRPEVKVSHARASRPAGPVRK